MVLHLQALPHYTRIYYICCDLRLLVIDCYTRTRLPIYTVLSVDVAERVAVPRPVPDVTERAFPMLSVTR